MLILAKAAMAMMLGFGLSIIAGLIIIPLLKKHKIGQNVSLTVGERHIKKQGTPTMGGLIFIIPTLIAMLLLYFRGSITYSHNLFILLFVFVAYAILGGIDDYVKIKQKNNIGLSISLKFILQMVIALIFFFVFMKNGGEPTLAISFLNLEIPMGWAFGLFILFLLVGTTNSIDALYEKGINAGALGGKLLGAGGGGFLVFYVQPEKRESVMKAMSELLYVPFKFENGGTRVIHYSPESYEPREE